jgi:hypothetical protein
MYLVHGIRAVLKNIPRKYQELDTEGLKEVYGSEHGIEDFTSDLKG